MLLKHLTQHFLNHCFAPTRVHIQNRFLVLYSVQRENILSFLLFFFGGGGGGGVKIFLFFYQKS